jgi:hypothetical protein
MSMENDDGMISKRGKTPDSTTTTRALWHSYQQSQLAAKEEELTKEMINLPYEVSLSYFERF